MMKRSMKIEKNKDNVTVKTFAFYFKKKAKKIPKHFPRN